MKNRIITISREFGSGGRTIGKMVSQKLGIACYDSELIQKTAAGSGFDENYIKNADERSSGNFLSLLASRAFGPTNEDYLWKVQCGVILELAEKGPCVFVGRLADYALREREDVLAVFLYAPKEWRIRRMMRMENIPGDEAARKRRRIDRERRSYCKYYTGREWDDCSRYDYMFNTASLTLETIAEILCCRMREEP